MIRTTHNSHRRNEEAARGVKAEQMFLSVLKHAFSKRPPTIGTRLRA